MPPELVTLGARARGYRLAEGNPNIDRLNPFRLMGRVSGDVENFIIQLEPGENFPFNHFKDRTGPRDKHATQESEEVPPLAAFVPTLQKAVGLALAVGMGKDPLFVFVRMVKAFEVTNGVKAELQNAFSLWWSTATPRLPAEADKDDPYSCSDTCSLLAISRRVTPRGDQSL